MLTSDNPALIWIYKISIFFYNSEQGYYKSTFYLDSFYHEIHVVLKLYTNWIFLWFYPDYDIKYKVQ